MADKGTETRYGQRSGSGSNEPKHNEKKEASPDWKTRQGGDQTAPDRRDQSESGAGADATKGKATKGHDPVATRSHLEGSEQGPS